MIRTVSKEKLRRRIRDLECKVENLEYALIQAGVFSYNEQPMYDTGYGLLVVNKGKK